LLRSLRLDLQSGFSLAVSKDGRAGGVHGAVNPCGKNGSACPLPPRPAEGTKPRGGGPRGSLVKRMSFRRSRSRASSNGGGGAAGGTRGQ